MSSTLFVYNGPTHLALKYASMKKKQTFTADDLLKLSPKRFIKPSRVHRSLDTLVKYGLLNKVSDSYQITLEGYRHLCNIAQPYRGEHARAKATR